MNANGYVAAGPGGEAFIVDPGGDGDRLLEAVQAEGWRLTAVLITHTHADHVADLEKVCRDRRVPVFVSPEGLGALPPGIGAEGAADGRILRLGEGLAIRVMATPGHSPDGLCFVVEPEEGAPARVRGRHALCRLLGRTAPGERGVRPAFGVRPQDHGAAS